MSGSRSHHAGLAAEDAVARHYRVQGAKEVARRWRGQGGEIDLIMDDGHDLTFIEVKASSTLEAAAQRLTHRQIGRVAQAAEEFLGQAGRSVVGMRLDAALVDQHGAIETIPNISMM